MCLFTILWLTFAGSARAQLQILEDEAPFAEDAVSLPLHYRAGVKAENVFAEWGIRFSGGRLSVPTIRGAVQDQPINITPPSIPVIRNEAAEDGSEPSPLVVEFRYPVRRVGFNLGNGDEDTQAVIRAFDFAGELLGEVTVESVDPFIGPWVGLQTDSQQGISRLTVDHGVSPRDEQLSSLLLEFMSRPSFVRIVPHLAEGRLSDGAAYRSTVTIVNLSNSTAEGEVAFFSSDGSPLQLDFKNAPPGERVEFQVDASSSWEVSTSGEREEAVSGYARIESNVPFEANVLFAVVEPDGSPRTQAGIQATRPAFRLRAALEQVFGSGTVTPGEAPVNASTGLAVVNTGKESQSVRIALVPAADSPLQFGTTRSLRLEAGEHVARFPAELFGSLEMADFKGSVTVSGEAPLAVTVLRTVDGLPVASFPVGTLER